MAFPRLHPRQASQVQITNVTAAGPGCEPNSFTSSISNTSADATLGFDAYLSALDPGVRTSDRKISLSSRTSKRIRKLSTSCLIGSTKDGKANWLNGKDGLWSITLGNL